MEDKKEKSIEKIFKDEGDYDRFIANFIDQLRRDGYMTWYIGKKVARIVCILEENKIID